jgi:hypothetical protein
MLRRFGRHKYGAVATTIDGIRFTSKAEGRRYETLKLMQRAGEIKDLQLQPKFLLQDKFQHEGKTVRTIYYVADFLYTDKRGKKIVEDVKGMKTEAYLLKRKLFLGRYGQEYEFREIG